MATTNNPPAKPDPKAKATYVATTPILHDGDFYDEDDEIELDAKAAKALGGKVAPVKAK